MAFVKKIKFKKIKKNWENWTKFKKRENLSPGPDTS